MNPPPRKKKLKKYQVVLLALAGFLITIYGVARVTNALQFYHIPTGSNEPTIKVGDYIYSSNLKSPKRFDFICYRYTDSMFGKQIIAHRLCGLPGDRIEIRNDTLFVNGENADKEFNLRLEFIIPSTDITAYNIPPNDINLTESRDSLIIFLQTKKDAALIKTGRPYSYLSGTTVDTYIEGIYHQPWTVMNFGPYIVPPGTYFVLGDNRHESKDSRYIGPVDIDQWIGTVLNR